MDDEGDDVLHVVQYLLPRRAFFSWELLNIEVVAFQGPKVAIKETRLI